MVAAASLDALRSSYRNWNKTKAGNAEEYLANFADDFRMGSLASGYEGAAGMAFSKSRNGLGQAKAYFADLLKDWAMLFFHVRDFIVQGGKVAVICECAWKHNTTGQVVHTPKLDLWTFKGRKAVEFFDFFDTDQAIGACADCGPVLHREPKPLYAASGAKVHEGLSEEGRGNLRRIKAFFKTYNASKGANFADCIAMAAPKIDWLSLANGRDGAPFTARRAGPAEVEAYFKGLYGAWEMIDYDTRPFAAGGPFIVMRGTVNFKNKRTGRTLITPKADCLKFSRGKLVEFMEYYDTAAIMRAAQ